MRLTGFIKRHSHLIILSATTLIALCYFSWGINDWRFSFVGDEWAFYTFAQEIISKHFLLNPLDLNGVYGQNSVLASYYQALIMQIGGVSNFSWRFSNILLLIPITILFYNWIKNTFNANLGLYSIILFQTSFYAANFFKIGYPQPLFLTSLILCLFLAERAANKTTIYYCSVLGISLGLAFYMRIGIFYPLILWPYLIIFLKKNKHQVKFKLISLIFFYLLLILPGLLSISNSVISDSISKTVWQPEFNNKIQILWNILQTFILFFMNNSSDRNHFVIGAYVDIITGFFILIGMIISFIKIRQTGYLIIILLYLSDCILMGATSPYSNMVVTRGIFFLPFAFIFAAIGIDQFKLHLYRFHAIIASYIIAIVFISIFCFNIWLGQINLFLVTPANTTGLILKSLQIAKTQKSHVYLILANSPSFNSYNLEVMKIAYGLQSVYFKVLHKSTFNCNLFSTKIYSQLIVIKDDQGTEDFIRQTRCLFKPPIIVY